MLPRGDDPALVVSPNLTKCLVVLTKHRAPRKWGIQSSLISKMEYWVACFLGR